MARPSHIFTGNASLGSRQLAILPSSHPLCPCCRQSFYSSRGSLLAEYASEAELRALVRTFGLYGARELGACTERPLAGAVSGLHAMLASNEELLSQLHAEFKVSSLAFLCFSHAVMQAPSQHLPITPAWKRTLG